MTDKSARRKCHRFPTCGCENMCCDDVLGAGSLPDTRTQDDATIVRTYVCRLGLPSSQEPVLEALARLVAAASPPVPSDTRTQDDAALVQEQLEVGDRLSEVWDGTDYDSAPWDAALVALARLVAVAERAEQFEAMAYRNLDAAVLADSVDAAAPVIAAAEECADWHLTQGSRHITDVKLAEAVAEYRAGMGEAVAAAAEATTERERNVNALVAGLYASVERAEAERDAAAEALARIGQSYGWIEYAEDECVELPPELERADRPLAIPTNRRIAREALAGWEATTERDAGGSA